MKECMSRPRLAVRVVSHRRSWTLEVPISSPLALDLPPMSGRLAARRRGANKDGLPWNHHLSSQLLVTRFQHPLTIDKAYLTSPAALPVLLQRYYQHVAAQHRVSQASPRQGPSPIVILPSTSVLHCCPRKLNLAESYSSVIVAVAPHKLSPLPVDLWIACSQPISFHPLAYRKRALQKVCIHKCCLPPLLQSQRLLD